MRSYLCHKTSTPFRLDGRLDKEPWSHAEWTEDFVDIEGDIRPNPRFRTRAKMMWNEECLFIGAELEEPQIWAYETQHDSVIFHDNDFEVFIDPNGDNHLYGEFEMNALNTTWDLLLIKPYRDGGPAVNGWEIKGLHTAVHIDGPFNKPGHPSKGWSVEIAMPWHSLGEIAGRKSPPEEGDQWRINFSRVEWHVDVVDGKYKKRPGLHEDNWVWSPQGVVDMHRPSMWGYMQFTEAPFGSGKVRPLDGLEERVALMEICEAQRAFRERTGHYAPTLKELGVYPTGAHLYVTPTMYEATIGHYHVDSYSRLWRD